MGNASSYSNKGNEVAITLIFIPKQSEPGPEANFNEEFQYFFSILTTLNDKNLKVTDGIKHCKYHD